MLLMYRENAADPYAIKVNADEFFRALKKCHAEGDTEMHFDSATHHAMVDLLEDKISYNNMERTVLIEPTEPVEAWLE